MSGVKERLPLTDMPTNPSIIQVMLGVAGKVTGAQQESLRFSKLAAVAAPLAGDGLVRLPETLVLNWIWHGHMAEEIVTATLRDSTGEAAAGD